MAQNIGFDLSGIGGKFLQKYWMLQRAYRWQLLMPHNFGGNIGYLVSQYCQDINFGDYSMEDLSKMRYGPYQRSYAGLQSIDTVTLTFLVPTDNSVYDYFYAWSNSIVTPQGFYNPKNEYQKTIFAVLYDRPGVQTAKFVLKGVFPITRPKLPLSYSSDKILTSVVTLSVDSISPYGGILSAAKDIVMGAASGAVSKAKGIFGV